MKKEGRTLDELSLLVRSELASEKEDDVITLRETAHTDESPVSLEINERDEQSVQIAPTENFLQYEFQGWSFIERSSI